MKNKILWLSLTLILLLAFSVSALAVSLPVTGMIVSDSYASGVYYQRLIAAMKNSEGISAAQRFVNIALSQKGYVGGSSSGAWAGDGDGGNYTEYGRYCGVDNNPWCAMFVSWCAEAAGLSSNVLPHKGYNRYHITEFGNDAAYFTVARYYYHLDLDRGVGEFKKIWSNDFTQYIDYKPQVGDLCLYMPQDTCGGNYNSWEYASHVVIVAEVKEYTEEKGWHFVTIERGNGNKVGQYNCYTKQDRTGVWGSSCHCSSMGNNSNSLAHIVQGFYHPNWSAASAWGEVTVDQEAPVVSNIRISEVSKSGYRVTCDISDNTGVTSVKFPTYTHNFYTAPYSETIWYEGTIVGNTATAYISTSDFNSTMNQMYRTEVRAYDAMGNVSSIEAPDTYADVYIEDIVPVITNVQIANQTNDGFDLIITATDNSGNIAKIQVAAWTDYNWQDDLTSDWTTNSVCSAAYGNDGYWYYRVKTSDHNNEEGLYYYEVYAWDALGNVSDYTSIACQTVIVDKTAPVISSVQVANQTKDGYDLIISASDNSGSIARMQVATWTHNNGQDDLPSDWYSNAAYTATLGDDGYWHYHVNASDHNNEEGLYYNEVYAIDYSWNQNEWSAECSRSVVIESTAPVISNVQVTDLTANGFTVTCTVTDNDSVSYVDYAVWSATDGQDDMTCTRASYEGTTASLYISTADHGYDSNCCYYVDIYAWDACHNGDEYRKTVYVDSVKPAVSGIKITEQTAEGYRAECTVTDAGEIVSVYFPTWVLDGIEGEADIVWYPGTIVGNTAYATISVSNHKGKTGYAYHTEVRAYDACGNISDVGAEGTWAEVMVEPDYTKLKTLTLPAATKTIKSKAFYGTAAEVIVIPEGCTLIASDAFIYCPNLKYIVNYSDVYIIAPSGVTVIDK